jgi:hypothetical protein
MKWNLIDHGLWNARSAAVAATVKMEPTSKPGEYQFTWEAWHVSGNSHKGTRRSLYLAKDAAAISMAHLNTRHGKGEIYDNR